MNRTDQVAEYLRTEEKHGVDRILGNAKQNRFQAIVSLAAACLAMDAALSGFGGGFALCGMFSTLFFVTSFRVFQVRQRRMASFLEFMGHADQWWPRMPVRMADMDGQVAAEAPADAAQLTHEPGERL